MHPTQDTSSSPLLNPSPVFKPVFNSKHESSTISDKLSDSHYQLPDIMLIPGHIHKYLVKNKVNIIDINNYKVVRQLLSMDDLADWMFVNDSLHLFENGRKYKVSSQTLSSMFKDISDDEFKLICKINIAWLNRDEIKDRLNNKPDLTTIIDCDSYKPYKVTTTTDTIIVVLYDGIIEYLNVSYNNILNFTRSVLQECYRINKIQDVSKIDLFRLYMRLL